MDGDRAELVALFYATKGPSEALQRRIDAATHAQRDIGGPQGGDDGGGGSKGSSGGGAAATFESPVRRLNRNVVFTGPPEMISSADEARAFNLK
jgi:hypothetical protein